MIHDETAGKRCRFCDSQITGLNKVKSHGISNSVFFKHIPVKDTEHRLALSPDKGIFNADQSGVTEKGKLCRECDQNLGPLSSRVLLTY